MNKYINYLRRKNGETIVETLAAILIAALSCTLLLSAVMAGVNINKMARKEEGVYQQELKAAELGADQYNDLALASGWDTDAYTPTTSAGDDVTVSISDGFTTDYKYKVTYTGGTGRLTSYELAETSASMHEGAERP